MSNYATKFDLKSVAGIDTSKFGKKAAFDKSNVDKLDIDKLKTASIDLSKRSNVVKKDFVKKIVYGELVKKVNVVQISVQLMLLILVIWLKKLTAIQKL